MLENGHRTWYSEANLIRSFSMIGIVIFHTLTALNKEYGYRYWLFHLYPNGNCGDVLVSVFFVLSGFLLYTRYSVKMDITFYKKGWLSIFPSFYLSWMIFYFVRVFIEEKPFLWGGDIRKIILTVLGMDGYFRYKGMNYYLVGEWFLGAIIILYLLFPLLLKMIDKYQITFCTGIIILWLWQINTNVFDVSSYRNIISCLVSFCIGMLFAKHYAAILKLQKNLFVVGIEIVLYVTCRCFHLPVNGNVLVHIIGAILYLLFVTLSMIIPKNSVINKIVTWIAPISFCIYLVHHRIIYMAIPSISKGDIYYDTIISLVICLTTSVVLGYIVLVILEKLKQALILT